MRELKDIQDKAANWALETMAGPKAIMIYKKKGRNVEAFCTCCGETTNGIAETVTLEDAAKILMAPVHNQESTCPQCGARGIWKARGRCRDGYMKTIYYIVGQRIGEDFVFRYCYTDLYLCKTEKQRIKNGEYQRLYLTRGKKAVRYYKYSNGEWGTGSPNIFYAGYPHGWLHFYPGTFKELKKTEMFRYAKCHGDIISYYSAFARYPDMEMVQKLGLKGIESALLAQRGANINPRGKTIWDRLRIYKSRMRDLKEKQGALNYLSIYQRERKEGAHYSDSDIERELFMVHLYSKVNRETMEEVFRHTTWERWKHYIDHQKEDRGPEYWNVEQTYYDYIHMRIGQGYDLDNDIYLFPKDLRRRHDEMVQEAEREEASRRRAEVLEKWPKIAQKYEKLAKKFAYKDATFLIRPAKDAGEIQMEGAELHHCVGYGSTYYSKHSKGESFILFLRRAEDPDTPFCTIEISGSRILQWYEAYDKRPDENVIQPWLDAYTERLKQSGKRNTKKKNSRKTA